jgi:5-methyltetrahydropteroyltriglutamate--homocysteine methyltransferase
MALSNVAGFPRIGRRRELKFATEGYWAGKTSLEDLLETGRKIRAENWEFMRGKGIDLIPSNDFSYYDQVLDTACLVGAIPPRYGRHESVDLDTYFAMARGSADVTAMEMTKWFDTNYHYLVPELSGETEFRLSWDKPFAEYEEAKALGIETVPVLVGPVSLLLLSKPSEDAAKDFSPLELLDRLVPVYAEVLERLGRLGAQWVQLDEPSFVEDRMPDDLEAIRRAYRALGDVNGRPKILVKTYFDHLGPASQTLGELPVEGIGLDFVRGPQNEDLIEGQLRDKTLFAGVVDGRNVWINELSKSLDLLDRLSKSAGDLVVSTSCSLLHLPITVETETRLDEELRSWIAFATEAVGEVAALTRGINESREAIAVELDANQAAIRSRSTSPRTQNTDVRRRVDTLSETEARRSSEFAQRKELQRSRTELPLFPTTTIGSFPQTPEIRKARSRFNKGELNEEQYQQAMRDEIAHVIKFQEESGLDVLVHGEAERNDMVQYFAEKMDGFAFTEHAWVQSYGSRYVRPPILFGDISRPKPITIEWINYAQSLTEKPVKGMLTGPVTMLMWSFVRDDQPRSESCKQLALAIRDEAADLEAAGVKIIQVDEPALREGLPLRRDRWKEYLDWAVFCFKVATSGVRDETQIQTHLCYSELGDILDAVDGLDADVNLMWSARAGMRLLDELKEFGYRNDVGPGVYDIHSPRVPSVEEIEKEIRLAVERLDRSKIWINPDCGLKTRKWEEAGPSLKNMVEAARNMRSELAAE